jgi:hypothetical protein
VRGLVSSFCRRPAIKWIMNYQLKTCEILPQLCWHQLLLSRVCGTHFPNIYLYQLQSCWMPENINKYSNWLFIIIFAYSLIAPILEHFQIHLNDCLQNVWDHLFFTEA